MKHLFAVLFLLAGVNTFSQKQRALLIGINDYGSPKCDSSAIDGGDRKICNLYGCKNDVIAMDALIRTRYGFDAAGINLLTDKAATRDGILNAINTLLKNSGSGDIAFLYYSGHGSQVRNSRSMHEVDRLDESIVPADTKKPGIIDIRDKELRKIFNKFLDKGVHLTVIFDCCHSSSISRGPMEETDMGRYAQPGKEDVKDASDPPIPERRTNTRGSFLIFSAAQDDEKALELRDANNIQHGAFTSALVTAVNQLSVNIAAEDILKSVKTILMNNGKPRQEPSLAGSQLRQQQTLFGKPKGTLSDRMRIPVSGIKTGMVEFLGGFAQGLQMDNELTMVPTSGAPPVVVRIMNVSGINKSQGKVIKGNINSIKPGALFEVTNWVSPRSPLLKLYIFPNNYTYNEVAELTKLAVQLKQSNKINWVSDLEKTDPYMTIFFQNNICYTNIQNEGIKELKQPGFEKIVSLAKGKPLYFYLPAPSDVVIALKAKFKGKNILFTHNIADANYALYGTANADNNMAFGWWGVGMIAKDSLESLPVQTGSIALHNAAPASYDNCADSLTEYAMNIGKARYWLNLSGPELYKGSFPFRLVMVNKKTKKNIANTGARIGDELSLKLVATVDSTGLSKVKEKFVYVFAIDNYLKMQMVYPLSADGDQDNKFPKHKEYKSWGDWLLEVELRNDLEAGEPSGTDNYFLIASDDPIYGYARLFTQDGIKAGSRGGESASPFEALVDIENESGSRGPAKPAPYNWSLMRLSVKTKH